MKMVVGLGNPGKDYENTRHNIGFMALNYFPGNINKEKFNALYTKIKVFDEDVLFVKPLTYMNLSGDAVGQFARYFNISHEDILIIQDDLDMDLGKYKLLFNRGDGGHNGIKNIILNLKSKQFLRLKIGISKTNGDTKDYVLGKLNNKECDILATVFEKLKTFIYDYVTCNRDLLMGKYNVRLKENNK